MASWEPVDVDLDGTGDEEREWDDDVMNDLEVRFEELRRFNKKLNPLKHIVPHVECTRNFDRILFLLRFYGSESKKIVIKLYIVGKLNS